MRVATENDLNFLVNSLVNTVKFMQSHSSDLYIDSLPNVANDNVRNLALKYLNDGHSAIFIEETDNIVGGCIIGSISPSSMEAVYCGKVGTISLCWVETDFRNSGIGRKLVNSLEKWFKEQNVKVVELSYMAQNNIAGITWEKLGYKPFRIFSYKEI